MSKKSDEDGKPSLIHWNYRDFQESAIEDQKLRRQLVAKALNLPYDEMRDVTVTHNHGSKDRLGPTALASMVLAAGVCAGGTSWLMLRENESEIPKVTPTPQTVDHDADTRYRLVPLPGE